MLSELEQEVVDSYKIGGTAAKHQCILSDLDNFEKTINSGEFPVKSELEETFGMELYRGYWLEFNITYSHDLARAAVNPLKVEQEAWATLSPIIDKYLNQVDTYLVNYPLAELNETNKIELLGYISRGKELLGDWQIVCKSYAAKYQRATDLRIQETENNCKDLIERLTAKK